MDDPSTLTYFLATTAIGGATSVIAWLVKRCDKLERRVDETTKETIDAMKVAAKLGERVPEMTVQLQQSNDENRLLRLRIEELERKS